MYTYIPSSFVMLVTVAVGINDTEEMDWLKSEDDVVEVTEIVEVSCECDDDSIEVKDDFEDEVITVEVTVVVAIIVEVSSGDGDDDSIRVKDEKTVNDSIIVGVTCCDKNTIVKDGVRFSVEVSSTGDENPIVKDGVEVSSIGDENPIVKDGVEVSSIGDENPIVKDGVEVSSISDENSIKIIGDDDWIREDIAIEKDGVSSSIIEDISIED